MMTPRSSVLLMACAGFALVGCSLFDPDYVEDPDVTLAGLLDPLDGGAPVDAITRERIRNGISRLATRFPSHLPSQLAAAALDIEAGESDRARGFVDRALALDPPNVEARVLRVQIAVADGSLGLARKLVEDGLALRPDASPLYESSAWVHQVAGEPDDALTALDTAERAGAPAWRVHFHRGLVEETRESYEAAARHYRAALDDNDACTAAQQRLLGLQVRGLAR